MFPHPSDRRLSSSLLRAERKQRGKHWEHHYGLHRPLLRMGREKKMRPSVLLLHSENNRKKEGLRPNAGPERIHARNRILPLAAPWA